MERSISISTDPFGTGMEWVLLIGVIIIIMLLIAIILSAKKAERQVKAVEASATATATNINKFVAKVESILDFFCKSNQDLPFCKT